MSLHHLFAYLTLPLIVAGAAADLVGFLATRDVYRRRAGLLLILGSGAAFLAFVSGTGAVPGVLARDLAQRPGIEAHQQWAAAGLWLLLGAGFLRALWRERLRGPRGWLTLGAGLLSALVILAIAASGFSISRGV